MNIRRLFSLTLSVIVSSQVMMAQLSSSAMQRLSKQQAAQSLMSQGTSRQQLQQMTMQRGNGNGFGTNYNQQENIDRSRYNNEDEMPEPESMYDTIPKRHIFGHDIFRSKQLSFEPNMTLAIASSYVLGAGDEVIIDVYGASQTSQKLKIAPDGSVTIPRIGPVGVSGLTVDQAQSRVAAAMGGHYKNSSIKVSVGQTRTISINVMGEVKIPGTYTLSAFATVFHALYMAGGVNELGTLRDIKVARNGRIISTVDVYEYIISGRLAGNVKLRDNDVIIVGSYDNLVQIDGKIKRPMWYEMKKNESLKALLRFCGGFTGDAYSKSITVNRRAGDKLSIYTVDEFDFTSFKLADEDSVSVGGNELRYKNIVNIEGAVKRPGSYGLSTVKTVRELIETAGGLEEDAITNRAVITRMNLDRTRKTLSVDVSGIMAGTTPDVALENEDTVRIASLAKILDERKMTIDGEVWKPGKYSYANDTKIEDLITMAGGLKESASLLNVEVARRIIDPSASVDSITLCESYHFTLTPEMTIAEDNSFTLKPYDMVFIRRSPVYEAQQTVNISGEVVFAGTYTLTSNNVRLSDIVKKAGGLKKNASAANARLIRRMDQAEIERTKDLIKMAKTSSDTLSTTLKEYGKDAEDFGKETTAAGSTKYEYTVGIDLAKALANPGSSDDITLRDSDKIIVPEILNTVKISGEVLHPNNVTFIAGKSLGYYIGEAGGYTKKSLRRRTYILYANGHVSKRSKGKVQPGCEIIVPKKPDNKEAASNVMKWVSIGSSITTVAAVVINALK